MDKDTRHWRNLAISAAATVGLLVARVLAGQPLANRHVLRNWLDETLDDEVQRRLQACETSIQELWRAHNDGQGSG